MINKVKISPKLDVKKWVETELNKNWFTFQHEADELGKRVLLHLRKFIKTHKKRPSVKHTDGTRPLEQSIRKHNLPNKMGQIGWEIGRIDLLNRVSPHWYVINYGKMITGKVFIPGGGKLISPGSFSPGKPEPDQSSFRQGNWKKGVPSSDGKLHSFKAKRPVEPMNYIENAQLFFRRGLKKILNKYRRK